MIDHDRLFKELLSTFFAEFLEVFFPQVWEAIESDSWMFLDKEVFTDVTSGKKYEADLIVQAKLKNEDSSLIIHLEHQSESQLTFPRRMFVYFSRLHEKYEMPVFPIAVFSFDKPKRPYPSLYQVKFSGKDVNTFNYETLQLNRLSWRDFVNVRSPIICALMAKMQMDVADRPTVKLECLRMLSQLEIDEARKQLLSGFIDIYLRLNPEEDAVFQEQLRAILPQEQEEVMEIVTSWMETGIEQGKEIGRRQEALSLVLRQLQRRVGLLSPELEESVNQLTLMRLEALADALLDFSTVDDLQIWLQNHS